MKELQQEIQTLCEILQQNKPKKFDGSLESLYEIVSEYTNTEDDGTRKHPVVFNRQLAQAIAYQLDKKLVNRYSLYEIGEAIGGRDHSLVIHSSRMISKYLSTGYMNDVIIGCAALFGLSGEDMTMGESIGNQIYIRAYCDNKLKGSFRNKKEASRFFGVSENHISRTLSEGFKLNNHTLKLEVCK